MTILRAFVVLLIALISNLLTAQDETFTAYDLFRMDQVIDAAISPDGQFVAYSVLKEKPVTEGKGLDYRELYVMTLKDGNIRPYITGKNYFHSLNWAPDSRRITFLSRMGDVSGYQVQAINLDGGAPYPVTQLPGSVLAYDWHPDGKQLALTSYRSQSGGISSSLRSMGFDAEIYEEETNYRMLFLYDTETHNHRALTKEEAVFDFSWSPKGDQILAQIAPQNLVDDSYMFKKLNLVNPGTGEIKQLINNPGKLTEMAWSPDGANIAFVSAADISDPVSGSLYVVAADNDKAFDDIKSYTEGFEGSVNHVAWKDNKTVVYSSAESVDNTLSTVVLGKKKRNVLLAGGKIVFSSFDIAGNQIVMSGDTKDHPGELYSFDLESGELTRRTHHNTWLKNLKMGRQEKISYKARDGLRIDGTLIYPVDYQEGTRYPLICYIHGGPESSVQNGWVTRYSMWGQMAAGQGYFVFMPNYRASSGRGVEFAKADHMDLADEEFNDVLDGIDYLVKEGMVDRSKVGIGGGSYGGYFSAWAATKHSEHFAASVVFVGISNQISKRNCTDIPYEDYHVHWRIWTHENPELVYDRSPVKYAKGSTTPTLILHGKEDTRVIPTQSLELYRQLKLHGDAPVRLVWYPEEGHGNRNNPAQLDYALRTLDWFDYYLKSDKPKNEMPPKTLDYQLDMAR